MSRINMLDIQIESLESEIQRVEVKYPLYARSLRTKLVRLRLARETEAERLAALEDVSLFQERDNDNGADGGHAEERKRRKKD